MDLRPSASLRTRIAPLFAPVVYRIDALREYMLRLISQTMISYAEGPLGVGKAGEVRCGERLPWVCT